MFPFLHIFASICCLWSFYDGHFDRCEVILNCNFYLHLSDDSWYWASLHVLINHVCLLWKKCSGLLLIFTSGFFFWILSCMSFLYILDVNPLSVICKYFLPFSRLYFRFVDDFLAVPKLLSLIRCHLSPFCKFCFQLIVILQKLKKLKVLVLLEFLIKTLTNIEQSAPRI